MAGVPGAVFFAHMRDGPMIRIRLPGGRATGQQLRAIAELARRGGNDRIALTNLSNFQVRGLEWINYSDLKRHLDQAGLLPPRLWAERRRNILADPLSGLATDELHPTAGLVARLDAAIQDEPLMKASSLKFGFVVDGGGPSRIGAQLHDAALIAESRAGQVRFRLYLTGQATQLTAAPEHAARLAVAAAVAALGFPARRDSAWRSVLKPLAYGGSSRLIAHPARMLLALTGPQETRIRRLLDHVPIEDLIRRIRELMPAEQFEISEPPAALPALRPRIGIVPQSEPGLAICGFGVPLGRLDSRLLALIAALAEDFGTGEVRLSPWHVVFIPHVAEARAGELMQAAEAAGFAVNDNFLTFDMSACSGRSGCRGARLETQDHALEIMRALQQLEQPPGAALSIHVSGCPKGCAHRTKSDILALEREDASGYYLYEDSAALTPDLTKRYNGAVSPEELPAAVCRLAERRGLASGSGNGHNRADSSAD